MKNHSKLKWSELATAFGFRRPLSVRKALRKPHKAPQPIRGYKKLRLDLAHFTSLHLINHYCCFIIGSSQTSVIPRQPRDMSNTTHTRDESQEYFYIPSDLWLASLTENQKSGPGPWPAYISVRSHDSRVAHVRSMSGTIPRSFKRLSFCQTSGQTSRQSISMNLPHS